MHFFVGEVIKFENLDSAKKGEDFWHGEKLIPISKAIEIIGSGRPFYNEIKEYRESQLKFLRRIQDGYKKRRL